jgi:hypothetical protein
MEVDNRKNEARTDLKRQDITVEVSVVNTCMMFTEAP